VEGVRPIEHAQQSTVFLSQNLCIFPTRGRRRATLSVDIDELRSRTVVRVLGNPIVLNSYYLDRAFSISRYADQTLLVVGKYNM